MVNQRARGEWKKESERRRRRRRRSGKQISWRCGRGKLDATGDGRMTARPRPISFRFSHFFLFSGANTGNREWRGEIEMENENGQAVPFLRLSLGTYRREMTSAEKNEWRRGFVSQRSLRSLTSSVMYLSIAKGPTVSNAFS